MEIVVWMNTERGGVSVSFLYLRLWSNMCNDWKERQVKGSVLFLHTHTLKQETHVRAKWSHTGELRGGKVNRKGEETQKGGKVY